ncbi:MAG TPA: hypothetical protein VFM05_00905 [Candidatus Saccharimonadales bacterium]|nr:hypothetical protein [Candidatus Saccharimonadales bacterium]
MKKGGDYIGFGRSDGLFRPFAITASLITQLDLQYYAKRKNG